MKIFGRFWCDPDKILMRILIIIIIISFDREIFSPRLFHQRKDSLKDSDNHSYENTETILMRILKASDENPWRHLLRILVAKVAMKNWNRSRKLIRILSGFSSEAFHDTHQKPSRILIRNLLEFSLVYLQDYHKMLSKILIRLILGL